MENHRYVNRLHWVFDLPDGVGGIEMGNEPTRIMMTYERATGVMKVDVLDKSIPMHVRENISSWVHRNSLLCHPSIDSDN